MTALEKSDQAWDMFNTWTLSFCLGLLATLFVGGCISNTHIEALREVNPRLEDVYCEPLHQDVLICTEEDKLDDIDSIAAFLLGYRARYRCVNERGRWSCSRA